MAGDATNARACARVVCHPSRRGAHAGSEPPARFRCELVQRRPKASGDATAPNPVQPPTPRPGRRRRTSEQRQHVRTPHMDARRITCAENVRARRPLGAWPSRRALIGRIATQEPARVRVSRLPHDGDSTMCAVLSPCTIRRPTEAASPPGIQTVPVRERSRRQVLLRRPGRPRAGPARHAASRRGADTAPTRAP
jgi:hypothetical protein